MKQIEGIEVISNNDYKIFLIKQFSENIKKVFRERLVEICYGGEYKNSKHPRYTYKNTIKEFIKRYEKRKDFYQKGFIGELLVNVLIKEYFEELETLTPFFNMEERTPKKGFDIVLTESSCANIWLVEIKSGECNKNKNEDQTISILLNKAKLDLKKRLNKEDISLWMEAVNGARLSYKSNNDLKSAVIDILESNCVEPLDKIYTSKNKNVIISSVLFSNIDKCFLESTIIDIQKNIFKEEIFKNIFVLAIQKGTFKRIYEFLKEEAN